MRIRPATLIAALLPVTLGWWDGGHMLVAEIARLQLTESEADTIDSALLDLEDFFPNNSDISSAAIWPDLLKCSRPASYCRTTMPPAISAFSQWHFNDMPFNPDNLTLPVLVEQMWSRNPSASWLLGQAVLTLRTTKCRYALNFMLRFALHVLGDMHQPLHATEGFFNNTRFGDLSDGDWGGNKIRITGAPGHISNLHALWDSGGALYLDNWPLDAAQKERLFLNATELMTQHAPPPESIHGRTELADCWRDSADGCESVFISWVNEMHAVAESDVYVPGLRSGGPLPSGYIENAQQRCKRQIALGGYRLGEFLRRTLSTKANWDHVSKRAARVARVEELSATVDRLESEKAVLITLTVAAFAAVIAAMIARGAKCLLLMLGRRRRGKRASEEPTLEIAPGNMRPSERVV